MAKEITQPAGLPLWKRLIFAALPLCVTLLLLEGLAALLGFEADAAGDPFVGFADHSPLYVAVAPEPDSGQQEALLETAVSRRRWVHHTRFTPEKRHGQFRVFTLGGSTTYGRPYDGDGVSFPGWLRLLLPTVDPSRHWEIINAGGISYASYRAALVMEELVAYQPDLFIVYTGHNEFLERRTYSALLSAPPIVLDAAAFVRRTHTGALLSSLLRRATPEGDALAEEPSAILDDSVGPDAYARDDAWAAEVTTHMRFNLRRMVDLAESAGARILFVTPASNLAAFSPFKSQPTDTLDADAAREVAEQVRRAELALAQRDVATALSALEAAIHLDPRNAAWHQRRGNALLQLGRNDEADDAFARARDEDVCPLRAPGPIVASVREVAAERGVALVDFEARVGSLSPDGIAGAQQFLDHVHPDAVTYGKLAEWIIDGMAQVGILAAAPDWSQPRYAELRRNAIASIDRVAEAAALRNLAKVLGWAGLVDEVDALLMRALERNPDDVGALINMSTIFLRRGDTEAAVDALARAVRVEPDDFTARDYHADALLRAGRTAEALAAYRALLELDASAIWTHNNLAWILANTGDPELRDAPAALAHARRAAELSGEPDPYLLDTLAAAHAANGDPEAAIAAADAAIALARSHDEADQVAELLRHRSLYSEGKAAPLSE